MKTGWTIISALYRATMLAIVGNWLAFPAELAHAQDKASAHSSPPAEVIKTKPDLSKPTLYVVGYAHLDTEWRWECPQVISEYLAKTMRANFYLFQKYPDYIFNFSGANRYHMMREYFPGDYQILRRYVKEGRWFPAGSSMEENDVNSPSPESITRQVLYGNEYFRHDFGVASNEYMLPDCFGFPASLPSILAAAGVKGFSTQKLVWGSSAPVGGPNSPEQTPKGIPFNVGVWDGPGGRSLIAAFNPLPYSGNIFYDLSKSSPDFSTFRNYVDWPKRIGLDGKATGLPVDYHYYGTGDIGGSPAEASVSLLEDIIHKADAPMPTPVERADLDVEQAIQPNGTPIQIGDGPVHVISSKADQMFLDILASGKAGGLMHFKGDLELTNHSAGSLTSQAEHKRWNRKNEILADAAEKASVAAAWLGGPAYPQERLNEAWRLVLGGQFHDLMAGTATPKSYEYSWNDDVIAMNQFAEVLTAASGSIASGLDTRGEGIAVVVYNSLNIERQDVVEARLHFPNGDPRAVRVVGPDGKEVPSQLEGSGRVLFLAKVPSVGYAVYDLRPENDSEAVYSDLKVSQNSLENTRYRVTVDANGDIGGIYDKSLQRELLNAPIRLALQTEHPVDWPAWNMDWSDQNQPPRAYVSGPASVRVVENGPARVSVEVTRQTEDSEYIQTVSLAAGDPGNRVVIHDSIDWKTSQAALKATFPLTASNPIATYNWGLGTVERGNNDPLKFEVASHQWFDLTDKSGAFGVTVLSDTKTGSDKPNDDTLRLTLLYTPGIGTGNGHDYSDQTTQDWGHHELTYGLAAHEGDWRKGRTDWQAQELNVPLIAFASSPHAGELGKTFSLIHVDRPDVYVSAVKKAEESNEVVIRLIEMRGEKATNLHIGFAGAAISAREINGQELPVGPASVINGELETSLVPYGVRTFAVKLGVPRKSLPSNSSKAVVLKYDLATANQDGIASTVGFNAANETLPAEMLPTMLPFGDITFQLGPAWVGQPNAVVARGQTIDLPRGTFNRVYILAAADGDQTTSFKVGDRNVDLKIQNWDGYIGQWDNRIWSQHTVVLPMPQMPAPDDKSWQAERNRKTIAEIKEHGPISQVEPLFTGLTPGFIKRAPVAWYASHHHNAEGGNEVYSYCYLFGYTIDLPEGATTVTLPQNDKIRIFAMTAEDEVGSLSPAAPLYDVLEGK
jgi:alpha-mannosidase